MLFPIVLFVYNRPEHLKATIESLQQNPLANASELFVFSDGAKNPQDESKVKAVRMYLADIQGFKGITINYRAENWGLANSVINGVNEVLAKYPAAIMVEDDMVFAPNFLDFMNDALNFYQNNPKIFSISGYTFPIQVPTDYPHSVFINPRASSWGWGTWQDRWAVADWQITDYQSFINNKALQKQFNQGGEDLGLMLKKQQLGQIDSWAIRWTYTHFKNQAYCLYPTQSKINNIGMDDSGTHSNSTVKFQVHLQNTDYQLVKDIVLNQQICHNLARFFRPSLLRRVLNWWKYGL
jgi:Glycosyl transferase family 2